MAISLKSSVALIQLSKPDSNHQSFLRSPFRKSVLSVKRATPMAALSTAPALGLSDTFTRLKKQGKVAFIPYITAGDPDLSTTAEALKVLDKCGSDIIELGVPYSDPLADGPVIQAAATRSLARGTNFNATLSMLKEVVPSLSCPLALFTYYNPILKRGIEDFMSTVRDTGVHGLVVPDVPLEETELLRKEAAKYNIELVLLTTPTTPTDRMRAIVEASEGFVYLVSSVGVTGARASVSERVQTLLKDIKEVIYIEACEAGSMFDGILPNDLNIYAVTASNKTEDSYATYCSYHDGPCLGDMFSVSWMEDSDESIRLKETLQEQYEMARYRTKNNAKKMSHVMQYGDLRLKDKHISNYQGINHINTTLINDSISTPSSIALSQYDADLFYFMHKVQRVPKASEENLKAYKELYHEISCRSYLDENINQIVKILFNEKQVKMVMETTRRQGKAIVDDWGHFKKLIDTYNKNCGSLSSYGLKYVKVIANMCNFGIQVDEMVKASKEVCQRRPLNLCKTL